MHTKKHVINGVKPDSIAMELELEPGDELISINGKEIEDVFDYQFLTEDEYLLVVVRKNNGEEWELEIEKDYDEDLGIEFENGLMDDYKSCSNKCMFCFIDQMPPGMRETLYFKDDDSRLSFLQGNYVTLTNMKDKDIERMVRAYDQRRNFLMQTFRDMNIECFEPFGAFYVFPCIKQFGMTSEEFAEKLLYQEKVAVVPGTAFGDCGEGYLRISYAYSIEELKEALGRIKHFIENL